MYQLHVAQAVVTLNKPQFAKTLIQCILVNTTSSMEQIYCDLKFLLWTVDVKNTIKAELEKRYVCENAYSNYNCNTYRVIMLISQYKTIIQRTLLEKPSFLSNKTETRT